jgi:putative ATPase
VALWRAEEDVESAGPLPVPAHLRDSHSPASRSIGAGKGYKYAHEFGGWAEQQHLPDELAERRYYEPITGREAELSAELEAKKTSPGRGRVPG